MANETNLKKSFLIWATIKEGFSILFKNLGVIILVEVIAAACWLAVHSLFFHSGGILNHYIYVLATFLISTILAIGYANISLKLARGEQVHLSDLFNRSEVLVSFIIAEFLSGFAIIIGLICLIIPGLILAVKFSLFNYVIIDKSEGPIKSLETSWNIIKGASWRLFFFYLVVILVNFGGLLLLGIGLLFTIPATMIATALVYRQLWRQTYEPTVIDVQAQDLL